MIYGISKYYGHVVTIKKWPNKTSAKTIAKWAEDMRLNGNTKRTIHYVERGRKGPDLSEFSLGESAEIIERISTTQDTKGDDE